MTASLNDFYEYVTGAVTSDATLTSLGHNTIWSHQAPEVSNSPYFIMAKQTGSFDKTLGRGQAFDSHFVMIKSVTMASPSGGDGGWLGRQAMGRLRDIITYAQPVIPSGYTISVLPNNDFEYREAESGSVIIYHVGIVFEVILGH